jgi:hypothetical protein
MYNSCMPLKSAALNRLIQIFERPNSLVMIGAGVSYPIVPLVTGLRAAIEHRALALGSFPAYRVEHDEISSRILGVRPRICDPYDHNESLRNEILFEHVTPSAVRAITVAALRPELPCSAPIQYTVFNRSRYRMVIVNFNNDGLASYYCGNHQLIHPHGTSLSPQDRKQHQWDSIIESAQELSIEPMLDAMGLVLPQREPKHLSTSRSYRDFERGLLNADMLAIIGYSFCEAGDWIAYNKVTSTISTRRIPSVIVSPDADELARQLESTSRSKNIEALSARWRELALAITSSDKLERFKTCSHSRLCRRCIAYAYEWNLDHWA